MLGLGVYRGHLTLQDRIGQKEFNIRFFGREGAISRLLKEECVLYLMELTAMHQPTSLRLSVHSRGQEKYPFRTKDQPFRMSTCVRSELLKARHPEFGIFGEDLYENGPFLGEIARYK